MEGDFQCFWPLRSRGPAVGCLGEEENEREINKILPDDNVKGKNIK